MACMNSNVLTKICLAAAVASTFVVVPARADDDVKTTWRLQGPGFSKHFSTYAMPIVSSTLRNDGGNLADTSLFAPPVAAVAPPAYTGPALPRDLGLLALPPTLPPPPALSSSFAPVYTGETANAYCARITPSASVQRGACLQATTGQYLAPRRHYQQVNAELGIEMDRRWSTGVERYFGGAVIDSYDHPSIYAGYALQRTIYSAQTWHVDAGATALLWWRTVPTADGERKYIVPAVLPMLSIEHDTGIGVNLSFVPQIAVHGVRYSVNTILAQITWAL